MNALHDSHALHGGVFPPELCGLIRDARFDESFSGRAKTAQFTARAKMRAMLVLPEPRGPEKR